jgi:ABC-2 type transport system ATP-binding protein
MEIGIKVQNIHKDFNQTKALNDVSMEIKTGVLHGLIGPEGAGKTTLIRNLVGLLHPTKGNIDYYNSEGNISFEKARDYISYMPQTQSLYSDLSIREHLDFFRTLYQISDEQYEQRKKELLEITRLEKFLDRPAGKLSGGMYKKLGLMCSLLRNPSVVLLDEPTNGVDPISRREFWELLYGLSDRKVTVLLATAYMDEAERCTNVHIMDNGQILESGDPREILENYKVKNFDEFFLKIAKEEDI